MKNEFNKNIFIGVSSCLLGHKVRYDGLDEFDVYIKETLEQQFQLVAVCPEFEIGMGVPREKIKLFGDQNNPRLMSPSSGTDWTERMIEFSTKRVKQDDLASISGFIFKSKSPSCGIKSVKLYKNDGSWERTATGLFARILTEQFPSMPVVEESGLWDDDSRALFIKKVIDYHKQNF